MATEIYQIELKMEEKTSGDEILFEHHKIVADQGQAPVRIDKYLMNRIQNTSRNKIQKTAEDGYIKVNDIVVKSNYKVKSNDIITVELPYPVVNNEIIPQDIPLDVLFEDDYILIINKKAGMVMHPGFGNRTGTLVNALAFHYDNLPDNIQHDINRTGLVHRLDKNTSGVIVVAKTEEALTNLSKQFFNRTTGRKYHALVWGDLDEPGQVEGHIGRSLKNRKVMSVFEDGSYGKHAITHYKPLRTFGYITLVECRLETGRTHQIRAHMKHLKHPVFNDEEYGGDKILRGTTFSKYRSFVENCFKLLPGQALHAKTLSFDHPHTGERMEFTTDLPDYFQEVVDRWENYLSHRKD